MYLLGKCELFLLEARVVLEAVCRLEVIFRGLHRLEGLAVFIVGDAPIANRDVAGRFWRP